MKIPSVFILALGFLAAPLFAADTKSDIGTHQLSEFHIGDVVSGPVLKLDDAKGKAVVIDAWGVNCGPCLALLPEVEKISKRYKDKMVVFGAECQNSSNEQIKALVTKNHLTYTVTNKGVQGPLPFSGIPHAFVFDQTGKLLFAGSPMDKDFDRALHHAVAGSGSSASNAADTFPGH